MLDSKTTARNLLLLVLAIDLVCAAGPARGGELAPAGAFRDRCAALARDAAERGTMTVAGQDGWLFLAGELRHLGAGEFWGARAAKASRASKPEAADPLPAILGFNEQLTKIGVALILVPVPAKAVIYPDFLPESPVPSHDTIPPRLDSDLQSFLACLKTNGVRVLDLAPLFLENRFHPDGPLYCKQDSHWSGNGCVLAARAIAGELRAAPGLSNNAPAALKGEWASNEIAGDLWQALPEPRPAKESVRLRRVSRADGETAEPDPRSPVILLGDSHNLVFHAGDDMHARGAGLADQLALELGRPVDLVAVRGSGATPARLNLLRRAQKDPAYWKDKRAVVWCFAAREFTESDGWRKAPIAPLPAGDTK